MTRVEKVMFVLVISLFLLPVGIKITPKLINLQLPLPASFEKGLWGMTINEPRPSFSLHGWFTRDFQDQFGKWFNQNYGARPFFVRMGNQLNYSLFNKSYMDKEQIIIGRNGQLFADYDIKPYCNPRPPIPLSLMESRVKEIAELQDLLARRGVTFLLVITPSKAATYPEYIPSNLCHAGPFTNRGYYDFVSFLDKYDLNYINGHVITQQAMQIEKTPLFSRGGIHWNNLGAYFTLRALIDRLKGLTNRTAGSLDLETLNVDHTPTGSDKDLAQLLNLLFPPFDYVVPHPVITKKSGTEDLGRIVIVGTSFNRILIELLEKQKIFTRIDFFFYYKLAFHSFPSQRSFPINWETIWDKTINVDVTKIDWEKTILKSDVIVLEVNEAQIVGDYSSAFVSDALQHLHTPLIASCPSPLAAPSQ